MPNFMVVLVLCCDLTKTTIYTIGIQFIDGVNTKYIDNLFTLGYIRLKNSNQQFVPSQCIKQAQILI